MSAPAARPSLPATGDLLRQIGEFALAAFDEGLRRAAEAPGEEQAVYGIVAEYAAEHLETPADRLLPAVTALCEGTPHDDREAVTELESWLLRLRVTYADPRDGHTTRTVEMIAGPGPAGARVRTVEHRMSRDDLPADVRQHFLRNGEHELTFQPYPRSN